MSVKKYIKNPGPFIVAAGLPITHTLGYLGIGVGIFSREFIRTIGSRKIWGTFLPLWVFIAYAAVRGVFVDNRLFAAQNVANLIANWGLPLIIGIMGGKYSEKIRISYLISFTTVVFIGFLAATRLLPGQIFGEKVWYEGMLWCFHHHNALASMLIIAIGIVFLQSDLSIIFILPLTIAFFLTGSRGYLLVSPVLFFGLIYEGIKQRWHRKIILLGAGILVGIGLMLGLPSLNRRAKTVTSGTWQADVPAQSRFGFWDIGFIIFRQHPIFGIGPGQLKTKSEYIQEVKQSGLVIDEKSGVIRHLHNFYLTVLAEEGMIGLIILLWLLYRLAVLLKKVSNPNGRVFLWAYWAFLLGNMFDSQLRGPSGAMDLFFMIGILLSTTKE